MTTLQSVSITADEIVAFLHRTLRFKEIYQEILHHKVIERAAQERNLTVSVEEIQADADLQRHEKRLEKAVDTLVWLQDQMITPEDWEEGIRDRLLAKKLSAHLFSKEVEKFFAQSKLDFDQVLLYQIVVPYERVAQEILYQIEEKEISFYEAAHFYDIDETRRNQCGYEGKIDRWSLNLNIAAAVFSSPPEQVIGPLETEQGYHLFWVKEFIPSKLTPERYEEILNKMFKQWIVSELNYMLHNS